MARNKSQDMTEHKRKTLAGFENDAGEVSSLFATANQRKANTLSMLDGHIAAAQELRKAVAGMK